MSPPRSPQIPKGPLQPVLQPLGHGFHAEIPPDSPSKRRRKFFLAISSPLLKDFENGKRK
ncbi:hypothetical protein M413DRAFT_438888 [Hebeloma cylindrosporum]|uniref:Uncharacterized protein n=1 Tax=Hebeloma cylindrosporum TaxID=76867 RepID=A0A0C2YJ06_HEBCY|nr:hypothetical protein M413DRAFT_438888 [Hebeloma cylindrosporum h7]